MSREGRESGASAGVNAGYAVFQLCRALTASGHDHTANSRQRVERWQQVVQHLVQGSAQYGSRTPLADVPAWVTLEVVTGGFATGNFLAGGALTEDERRLADAIAGVRPGCERLDLNAWHLTDEGIHSLQARLASGDYRVDVPEEAALLTVAWLLGRERTEQARRLIESIAPFFDRLRFFPAPSKGLAPTSAQVQVVAAGDVRQQLSRQPPQKRVAVHKRVVETLLPLYDAAVSLLLQTCEAGWPLRVYPEGWFEQATTLCNRFDATHGVGEWSKERAGELYAVLRQCVRDPAMLTGRQVGRVRHIINGFVAKHGHPESERHLHKRSQQRADVAAPEHHVIARAVSDRLDGYPALDGIDDFAPLLRPISREEAQTYPVAEGTDVPCAVRRRLERCRRGTIAELIDARLISSADTVAQVLPAMTADINNAGFDDEALRRLAICTYRAFRRRRSLLLLNLQSQVKISELPWVAAVEAERGGDAFVVQGAKQALTDVAVTTLRAFPQAIVPNKLLQEFRSLAATAKLDVPWVEEIAADIFMGAFSDKYAQAAKRAARVLKGTLYARYYNIDTEWVMAMTGDVFASHCAVRANRAEARGGVAANGTIIEQQQILTTQNLAVLFDELGLRDLLQSHLGAMALQCFRWICRRQQVHIAHYHAYLVTFKNTAYAWRQMLFYLSMLEDGGRASALQAIETHFADQPAVFRARLLPAMVGLRVAVAGDTLTVAHQVATGARVFLGWTIDRHWLMPPPDKPPGLPD